jgi:hypothetical protein
LIELVMSRLGDDLVQRQDLHAQLELFGLDAGGVHQVIHQARQEIDLALHDVERLRALRPRRIHARQAHGAEHRAQGLRSSCTSLLTNRLLRSLDVPRLAMRFSSASVLAHQPAVSGRRFLA